MRPVEPRFLKSGFLFVLAAFADDVGDVVVALFLLLDERRLFGLLDLDVVVAFGGFAVGLLARGLGVGVLERNQLDVGGLRLGGLGSSACRGGRSSRSGCGRRGRGLRRGRAPPARRSRTPCRISGRRSGPC